MCNSTTACFVTVPSLVSNSQGIRWGRHVSRRGIVAVADRMRDAHTKQLHPVLEILKYRMDTDSRPGQRKDSHKVALCIEGGGMRGAVSAGMVAAIKYIGLENAFDVVYGCSAGSIIGSYLISRQLPVYGAQIYYDTLCSIPEDGKRFIDLWALRHHPYFRPMWRREKEFYVGNGRPVMLLDRLLDAVRSGKHALDWDRFWKQHEIQPLIPIATNLRRMEATTLQGFTSLDELMECLRASARVPGIAGGVVEIDGERYVDGVLFEAIPFRSALRDGCTEVLVLRSRGGTGRRKRAGVYEKWIAGTYFERLEGGEGMVEFLRGGKNREIYGKDVKRLEEEQENGDGRVFSVEPGEDVIVGQLECRAKVIFEAVRSGFAAGYERLSVFGEEGRGEQAAKWVFRDDELKRVERDHAMMRRGRRRRRRCKNNNVG